MQKGQRVKLIFMDDKYTDLKNGDKGTISHIDDIGNIHVKWDSGSSLALIPDIDKFELIDESIKSFNELFDTEELRDKHEIEYLSGMKIPKVKKEMKQDVESLNTNLIVSFPILARQRLLTHPEFKDVMCYDMTNDEWYLSLCISILDFDKYDMCIKYKKLSTPITSEMVNSLVYKDDTKIYNGTFTDLTTKQMHKIIKDVYSKLYQHCGFKTDIRIIRHN